MVCVRIVCVRMVQFVRMVHVNRATCIYPIVRFVYHTILITCLHESEHVYNAHIVPFVL